MDLRNAAAVGHPGFRPTLRRWKSCTKFGNLVKIQEAENQFVVDYQAYERRPEHRTLLIPTVVAHERVFGRPPRLLGSRPRVLV